MPRAVERFQVYPRQARGGVEPDAVAEQHRQDVCLDLVHEPAPQALAGHVSAEDLEVLASGGGQGRGDRFTDVQSIASSGPAMKPSSDIDRFTTTLPVISRCSVLCRGLFPRSVVVTFG